MIEGITRCNGHFRVGYRLLARFHAGRPSWLGRGSSPSALSCHRNEQDSIRSVRIKRISRGNMQEPPRGNIHNGSNHKAYNCQPTRPSHLRHSQWRSNSDEGTGNIHNGSNHKAYSCQPTRPSHLRHSQWRSNGDEGTANNINNNNNINDGAVEEAQKAVPDLCTGVISLCTLYYIRLKQKRRLREQQRRRRMLLFRHARSQDKLRFAVLWMARQLTDMDVPTPGLCRPCQSFDHQSPSREHSSVVWDTVIEKAFSNFDWIESFRMTKSTFDYLCDQLRPAMQKTVPDAGQTMPLEVRLAITLWRLGSSSPYRTNENIFGVSRSAIVMIVRDVCEAIISVFTPRFIRVPCGNTLQDTLRGFEEQHGLPQLAGVVGTLHVAIQTPAEKSGQYFNNKGWHSVVVQAVVNADLCFWDLNIDCPGNLSDSQVLVSSELYKMANRGTLFPSSTRNVKGLEVPIHLLGPRSYPLLPWLMTPFTEETGRECGELNRQFSSALGVIDMAFERLKGRWCCLLKSNDFDLCLLPTLITACCTLHNICEHRGDPFEEHWLEVAAEEDLEQPSESDEEDSKEEQEVNGVAKAIRTALASFQNT
eukprot:XP_004920283.1 PREDICTED: putative nuclease HARBI1 [Xenopus tropicalis]